MPLTNSGAARARDRARARAQSVGFHLLRDADLSGRRARGRGDRPRARPARASRGADRGDRRPAASWRSCARTPIATIAPLRAAGEGRPARRSSAARRSPWKASARAPMRRSTATMRRTGCCRRRSVEVDGRSSSRSRRRATRPTTSASRVGDALVHRRPCDGLVDHRRRSAGRRHGRLHGQPRETAAARRPHLLSGAWAAGDQPAAICPRADRPPDAAREADPAAGRGAAARHSRTSSPTPIPASIRGW